MKPQLEDFLPHLKECIGNIDKCMDEDTTPSILSIPMNKTLSEFIRTFYSLDILNGNYSDYLEERDITSMKDIADKCDNLSLEELYAVLTLYIRTDRFVEGRLVSLAEKGILYKTVKRIVELA